MQKTLFNLFKTFENFEPIFRYFLYNSNKLLWAFQWQRAIFTKIRGGFRKSITSAKKSEKTIILLCFSTNNCFLLSYTRVFRCSRSVSKNYQKFLNIKSEKKHKITKSNRFCIFFKIVMNRESLTIIIARNKGLIDNA